MKHDPCVWQHVLWMMHQVQIAAQLHINVTMPTIQPVEVQLPTIPPPEHFGEGVKPLCKVIEGTVVC